VSTGVHGPDHVHDGASGSPVRKAGRADGVDDSHRFRMLDAAHSGRAMGAGAPADIMCKMHRMLITGGCGFIGSALCREFGSGQTEVFVVDDLSYGSRDFVSIDDAHFLKHDILDRDAMFRAFREVRPETVLHLAAIHFIPHCNQFPYQSSNINLLGTLNVLDAAKACGSVGKVLFASTAAVYPIAEGPVPETHPLGPLDVYGMSKLVGERLCHGFHLETGIPTVVCRFFNAFGPNETNPHLIPEVQKQVNSGLRTIKLGNLDPKRDFIHTYDMASAMRALVEKFRSGYDVFNLGRGEEYSVREIVAAFAKEVGEEIRIEVDPARVRKVERMHLLADVSKLKAFTGWAPRVSLQEGIRTLVREDA
jgi:UDP-glucose 4-epimerase